MHLKHALLALAASGIVAPAAFAQSSTTVTTTTVMGAPATVTVAPSNSGVNDFPFMRYQNSVVAAEPVGVAPVVAAGSNTAVMGAPAAPVVRYWWNVPSDIGTRADFRRYRSLL
jgi:hypothetical protein